jgi:hypothetical protein
VAGRSTARVPGVGASHQAQTVRVEGTLRKMDTSSLLVALFCLVALLAVR